MQKKTGITSPECFRDAWVFFLVVYHILPSRQGHRYGMTRGGQGQAQIMGLPGRSGKQVA